MSTWATWKVKWRQKSFGCDQTEANPRSRAVCQKYLYISSVVCLHRLYIDFLRRSGLFGHLYAISNYYTDCVYILKPLAHCTFSWSCCRAQWNMLLLLVYLLILIVIIMFHWLSVPIAVGSTSSPELHAVCVRAPLFYLQIGFTRKNKCRSLKCVTVSVHWSECL